MAETVASNDVFDGNAETIRELSAQVLGHFAQTGPNSWDPYEFVAEAGGVLDLLPGVVIQREGSDARFRV